MRLHGVERHLVDDRWHRHGHHLAEGLHLPGLGTLVELVFADIGLAGQDAVNLPDPPAPAIAGEDAVTVKVAGDILDAHRAGGAVALQGQPVDQPVDQPDGVGVQRVDVQLLLDLGAARLGGDDAVADRRQ